MKKTLQNLHNKIVSKEQLINILQSKNKSDKTVFTNGCFDLVHRGHIEYLSQARDLGDLMVIGLNTDASVSRIKGEHRPLQDEKSRALVLAAMSFVDYIILFNEETPHSLIEAIQPDVLVKGSDYKIEDVVGYDIILAKGGTVQTIELTEGYSTSKIEEKIKSS